MLYSSYYCRRISPARSPMMMQGAIVLPVVTRGLRNASAIGRFWILINLKFGVYNRHGIAPIFSVQV